MAKHIVFEGEIQLLRWSDTSTQGATVTFQLADHADLEQFKSMTLAKKGMTGQRLAAVMVELGDDEQPVEQPVPKVKPKELCIMACTFCADLRFQEWADSLSETRVENEGDAKFFILNACGVHSRKELDSDPAAAMLFHARIREPYLKWKNA